MLFMCNHDVLMWTAPIKTKCPWALHFNIWYCCSFTCGWVYHVISHSPVQLFSFFTVEFASPVVAFWNLWPRLVFSSEQSSEEEERKGKQRKSDLESESDEEDESESESSQSDSEDESEAEVKKKKKVTMILPT